MRGRVTPRRSVWTAAQRARAVLVGFTVPVVLAGVGSLVAEFGFDTSDATRRLLHIVQAAAVAGLVLEPAVQVLVVRQRGEVLLGRWYHFALAGLLILVLGVLYGAGVEGRGAWALRVLQIGLVLNVLMRLVELNRLLASMQVRPALLFLGSFLALIAMGTGLLILPKATVPGETTTFTDALFTATSAVCVTGLVVEDTGTHWDTLGRYAILVLIQLGGLGVMTFGSVFALLLWRGMRVRESVVMREVLSSELLSEVGRIIVFIFLMTLAAEAVGAVLMAGLWEHTAGGGPVTFADRIAYSVFHSVSAFCNAGFCLYTDSLMAYRDTWQTNLLFPVLIIAGGIGFMVLYNLQRVVRYGLLKRGPRPRVGLGGPGGRVPVARRRLSLQSKLALVTTAVLLVTGTVLALVFETARPAGRGPRGTTFSPSGSEPGVLAPPPAPDGAPPGGDREPLGADWPRRASGAWFLSVTARTAGFNTTDTRLLTASTKFMTVVLMFIGASPGSTGGGIKTVTVAVILIGVWGTLRGRGNAQAFKRTIARTLLLRALAVLAVSVLWVALVTMAVAAWGIRDGAAYTFLDVLFETVSAFATVGLSTGTTPLLNTAGRILIIVTMYIGRVGPLTLFVAMPASGARTRYLYATENVAIL